MRHTFKRIYHEAYKARTVFINSDSLPTLRHLQAGFFVRKAELTGAGKCELDGKVYEYSDLRVYVSEQS